MYNTDHIQRWLFWINLPFIGIAFVFVPLFLKLYFKQSPWIVQLKRVDWIGSFIFIASSTSFLIPITWVCPEHIQHFVDTYFSRVESRSWRTLVPLILGTCGLIGFALFEEYVAAEPLIRLIVFKNWTAAVTYAGTFLQGMILWSLLYYLPLYYEAVKGQTPIIAGISIFPETFTVAPAAVVVGILITKTGRYRWAIWGGWVLTNLGTGLLYLLDVHTSTVRWIFINLVSGLGLGMLFPSMAFAIQASSTNADLAFAIAMFAFFRAFGQAVGVAIGGTIFQNQMKIKLLAYPGLAAKADQYSRDATSLVRIIKGTQDAALKLQLQQSYADALKIVWVTMCGLSALGFVLSLWTKGLDLNKPLETEQGMQANSNVDEEKK